MARPSTASGCHYIVHQVGEQRHEDQALRGGEALDARVFVDLQRAEAVGERHPLGADVGELVGVLPRASS